MAGKRIAAPEETAEVKRKGSRRAIWIAGAVLAVLVAAWAGLCLYASGYGGVLPGVTMAGEDLGGLSLDHAEEQLSEALEGFLTGRVVAVAADGEDLGTYDLAELGAYAVAGEAAQAGAPAGGAARPGAPKKRAAGSIAFVPSAAGLVLAGEVIRDLALPGQ